MGLFQSRATAATDMKRLGRTVRAELTENMPCRVGVSEVDHANVLPREANSPRRIALAQRIQL